MILFQWLTVPLVLMLLLRDFAGWLRTRTRWRFRLVRGVFWLTTAITIIDPSLMQTFADVFGIGRGTDLLLYLLALSVAAFAFYAYSQILLLRQQVCQLARHMAIGTAKTGGPAFPIPPCDPRRREHDSLSVLLSRRP